MGRVNRRGFVGTMGAAAGMAAVPGAADGATPPTNDADRTVYLYGDGIDLEPAAYAALLHRLTSSRKVQQDGYLLEGEVAAFEQTWAALLGKERAVFMPSGTLANQLALRTLAGDKRRVIVQDTSHVYNDTGDACQTLSRLTLVPLAPNAATYSRADVEAVLARTASGRVATGVGALSIESPVRRRRGEMFDWQEAQRICAYARERGIGTHLDGARVFIASAYTGIAPKEYAAPFDTVYVSLWKTFNCGIGAILAGPARLLDDMFHARRMFGGNLWQGWPAAVVARHYMDGFVERLRAAVAVSEDVFRGLAAHPRVAIERVGSGTNVALLTLRGVEPATIVRRLADRGVKLGTPTAAGTVTVNVNETWARMPATTIVNAFEHALA